MDLYMSADMLYINFRWAHMRWFNNAHHWLHNVRFSQRRLVRAHIFQLLHSISQHGMMASWWQKKNCDGYEMMGGTTIWLSTKWREFRMLIPKGLIWTALECHTTVLSWRVGHLLAMSLKKQRQWDVVKNMRQSKHAESLTLLCNISN